MPIAREAWPIVVPLFLLGGAVSFRYPWPGAVVIGLGFFVLFFFRDPNRVIPADPRLVLSPADGRVVKVVDTGEGPLGPGSTQVSVFLSVLNVHVNRAPIGGRIVSVDYRKGAFLPAFDDRASLRNEQNAVTIEDGPTRVVFKQIAGVIARRIVFRKKAGDAVARGERVGLIKFGSRVDVFLPAGTRVRVKVGDRVHGGCSILGELP